MASGGLPLIPSPQPPGRGRGMCSSALRSSIAALPSPSSCGRAPLLARAAAARDEAASLHARLADTAALHTRIEREDNER